MVFSQKKSLAWVSIILIGIVFLELFHPQIAFAQEMPQDRLFTIYAHHFGGKHVTMTLQAEASNPVLHMMLDVELRNLHLQKDLTLPEHLAQRTSLDITQGSITIHKLQADVTEIAAQTGTFQNVVVSVAGGFSLEAASVELSDATVVAPLLHVQATSHPRLKAFLEQREDRK